MNTYTFKIHHDNGTYTVTVKAFTVKAAKYLICNMENCPLSALDLENIEYHR